MAAITSNGTGGGLWSDTATWVGAAVPVDGDSVTIALGDTVTFDVDQSGFATGLAGLVCTGVFQCSTTAGTYHLKMAGNITAGASGGFHAGTSSVPLPISVQFNIQFNGAYQFINISNGQLQLFCTNPTHKYVRLVNLEVIGSDTIEVDTDVTSDIWKTGDTVRLCDIGKTRETEEYTINTISPDTITLTGTLSVAKSIGAFLVLCSRNIKVYGHTAGGYAFNSCHYATINCEIYGGNTTLPATSGTGFGVFSCISSVFDGCAHGCSYAFRTNDYIEISGVCVGNYYAAATCYGAALSGFFAGNYYGNDRCHGSNNTGEFYGNVYGLSGPYSPIFGGIAKYNGNAIYNCSGATISGVITDNSRGLYTIYGATLKDVYLNNDIDMNFCWSISGINCTLDGIIQISEYQDNTYRHSSPFVLWDIGGISGAVKSWMYAGRVATDTATFTTGIAESHKFILEQDEEYLYLDWEYLLSDGEILDVDVYMKKDTNGMTLTPRCQILDSDHDPIYINGTSAVSEQIMTDNTDWQTKSLSYTSSGQNKIIVRVLGQNSSGNFWAQVVRNLATGTSYDGPACPKTVSGAMYPRMS